MNYKTKVSYQSNPNGNIWLKDQTGFGQKMLAKMGWTEGKGLGRDNQGITKAITVKKKSDARGVGCTKQWAEMGNAQMDAFADVLTSLNSQNASPRSENGVVGGEESKSSATMGLEERSRSSKFRLHYGKFTRGKDLSRYSEDALKCIVGARGISASKSKAEEVESAGKTADGGETVCLVSSVMNMADYFRQKMEEKKNGLHASNSAPQLARLDKASSDDESLARPTFGGLGFGAAPHMFSLGNSRSAVGSPVVEEEAGRDESPPRPSFVVGDASCGEQKSRKRKREEEAKEEGPGSSEDGDIGSSKKKKKSREDPEERDGCPAAADGDEADARRKKRKEKKKGKEEVAEAKESADEANARRKKKKSREDPEEGDGCPAAADGDEVDARRKKRKAKEEVAEAKEGADEANARRKKKKGRRKGEERAEEECGDETAAENSAVPAEENCAEEVKAEKKKKKKKRRGREEDDSCDSQPTTATEKAEDTKEEEERKARKKKKKKRVEEEAAAVQPLPSAALTKEDKEVLSSFEGTVFSTSNLKAVAGYKYYTRSGW